MVFQVLLGVYLSTDPYPYSGEQWLEVAIIDDNLGYVLLVSSPFTETLVSSAVEPVRAAVYVALLINWLKSCCTCGNSAWIALKF